MVRTYVDVHHHFRTEEMAQLAAAGGLNLGGGGRYWSPEAALPRMDAVGIAAAVISPIIFVESIEDAAHAAPLVRATNDFAASVIATHPERFGAFAAVPLCDATAAIDEIERALDTLRLDGVLLATGLGEELIGAPRFAPILAELDARGAVVHLHPGNAAHGVPGFPSSTPLDFPVETTRAIGSLLACGAFERYPRIRWIMAHGGGAFPYIAGRVSRSDAAIKAAAPAGTMAYLRRLYFDVAVCCHPTAMPSLRTVAEPAQLLFGTDMPAFSDDEVRESVRALEHDFGFTNDDLDQIACGTAAALFPRLVGSAAGSGRN